MKRKFLTILLAAVFAASFLAGCGSDETADSGSSAESEDPETVDAATILEATDYDIQDYVTLGDYTSLSVELEDVYEVTDQDIEDYVEYLLALYPAYETTDKTTVEDGDLVNIDYVGTLDGEEFDGGSDEGYRLEIGSDTFIDGFEDGLIGATVGETVELDLTFPDDYSSEDLAGQDVVFTVTINSIDEEVEITYDTITDEYVEENFSSSGLTTVDDFIDALASTLESSYSYSYQSDLVDAATEALLEISEVEIPGTLLEDEVAEFIAEDQESAEYYEMEFEDYLEDYYGMTEEEYYEEIEVEIEASLLEQMIYEALVYAMDITVVTEDFESWGQDYVDYYGYDDLDTFFEDNGGRDYMRLVYAENQALTELIDMVDVTLVEADDDEETEE